MVRAQAGDSNGNLKYYGNSQYKRIMKYMRRPDIIVVQKDKNLCQIIDSDCPYDGRADRKELEKIEHYQDWHERIEKDMENESQGYIIFLGALGTTRIKFRNWLNEIGIETQITELEKIVLLHIARVLRKVLEV